MTFSGVGFANFDGDASTARCSWGAVATVERTLTVPTLLEDGRAVCASAPVTGFGGAYYFVAAKLSLNGIEFGVPQVGASAAASLC